MTVKELINELGQFEEDSNVYYEDDDGKLLPVENAYWEVHFLGAKEGYVVLDDYVQRKEVNR